MVKIFQKIVRKRNLKFGTDIKPEKSKTKCILFGKQPKLEVKKIVYDENMLPWVSDLTHLGMTLQQDNSMKKDMDVKRAIFNNKVNSLLQEFHFASLKY